MTNREFYEAVKAANINDELTAFAEAAIDKLDATNATRRDAAAKKALERETERGPIREAIVACINEEPKTATTLISEAGVEIKPQSVPSLLKGLVESGVIVKAKVKVKGKGAQVGYMKA